jgi:hypothetical protein
LSRKLESWVDRAEVAGSFRKHYPISNLDANEAKTLTWQSENNVVNAARAAGKNWIFVNEAGILVPQARRRSACLHRKSAAAPVLRM